MMPDKAERSHGWLLLLYLFIAAPQPLFALIESLESAVGQEQITIEVEGIAFKEIGLAFPKTEAGCRASHRHRPKDSCR